jgi:bifunctional DNA-binding transcriptional regulator/antitoxin component of YhaV-PrlF toxin-antitoxin module
MPRLSRKNQITIPVEVLRKAGLEPGDDLRVRSVGRGRVAVERRKDVIGEYAGALAFPSGYLDELRGEWER